MIGIIMAITVLGIFEITPLIINKKWKELAIVCCLFALGLTLGITYYNNPKIKGPIELVTNFMKYRLGITYNHF
ncbi:MAG: hypothetical protein ACOX8S_01370 [Christensenellales bacterium]|jgi:uncharacterized membrane protein